jgi:ABC-2 type transport system permease protein
MRTVWAVLRKDITRRLRSPLASIVYLLFPFVFSGLIAVTFGSTGHERAPRFKVALVNEDGGFVAGLVMGAFNQQQVSRVFEPYECTLAEAERRIAKNKVAGAIVIPAGFSTAVLERQPARLRVIRNPAEAVGPVAVEEAAAMIAQFLDAAASVLSEPLGQIAQLIDGTRVRPQDERGSAFPTDARVAEIAAAVNGSLRGALRFALPPVITLAEGDPLAAARDTTRTARPAGDTGASAFQLLFRQVLPGMATFALLFLALGFVGDIPREKTRGTLARQLAAPVRASAVLAGKLLSAVAMALLVALGMALIGAALLGVRADLPAFIVMSLAFVAAATGLLSLVFGVARSEQQGGTLAAILVMTMSMLGGSWFSVENLPAFLRHLAPATLNYWGIRGYRAILVDAAGLARVGLPIVVLLAIAIAGTLGGSILIQRRLMRGA